jgi:hypothetical protein
MKTTTPRVKRPEPERTQPNRAWSGVFGSSPAGSGGSGPSAGWAGAARAATAGMPGGEAVRRGVDLGYRVIDEYLKQGQAFARSASSSMPGGVAPPDLSQMTERMFKYAADFASVWLQAVGMIVANGPPAGTPPGTAAATPAPGRPAAPTPAPQPLVPLRVGIEIVARRRTRARLEMERVPPGVTLAVPALAVQAGGAQLDGVAVAVGDDGPVVQLKVGPKQVAGVYSGPVVDQASNLPVGKLTVWIEA